MRRGRSRPSGAQVAEQLQRRARRRPPEAHLLERRDDRAAAGVRFPVHEPLLIVAKRDQDRRRLPAALDEDRVAAALELAEHASERLPELERVDRLHVLDLLLAQFAVNRGTSATRPTRSRLPMFRTSRAAKIERERRKAWACLARPSQLATDARADRHGTRPPSRVASRRQRRRTLRRRTRMRPS